LNGKGFTYSLSKYCMQKNVGNEMENIKEDYLKEWMPMVCVNERLLQKPVLITSKEYITQIGAWFKGTTEISAKYIQNFNRS